MIMNVPVGKTSNNDLYTIDLFSLPHLFLSFGEQQQLTHYLQQVIKGLHTYGEMQFAGSLSKRSFELISKPGITEWKYLFIRNEDDIENSSTRYLFLQQLVRELKRRQKRTLNRPVLIVFIEDVLDLVITKRRSTGLQFLQLLIEGPASGIHVMAASGRAYRNLLLQLLNLNPVVKEQLLKQLPGIDLSVHYPLGAELVITPEEVYFFRQRNQTDYIRLFPL